jgi:hypothetical protein
VAVNNVRSNRIRPAAMSTSYLLRVPLGISIVTSNSMTTLRAIGSTVNVPF